MRAVLDPNVLISALLSRDGTPAEVLRAWRRGVFDLVVSPSLLDDLERALAYPKLRSRIKEREAGDFRAWLETAAEQAADPGIAPTVPSSDPGDDYLLALAAAARAALVSGDKHLLALSDRLPVYSPRDFLSLLAGLG